MSADPSPALRSELLDDFYAECDEHLGHLRLQLQTLESAPDGPASRAALESVYRSIHSFKGNTAIVGLTAAEHLAHALEDLLRRLSRGEVALSPALLDLIGQTGLRLEQMVATFRQGQPLPDASGLEAELRLVGAGTAAPRPEPVAPPPEPAGSGNWGAVFSPSAELDARGVNITSVRARLAELGRIAQAAPTILPGGRMSFEFQLELSRPPEDPAAWAADGVVLRPLPAPAAIAPEPSGANAPGAGHMFVTPSHIVRVDLGRLDELMRIAGEMVIQRSRLDDRLARARALSPELQEVSLGLGRLLKELREAITRVRLVPVAEIFSRLPMVVRDLGRDSGKEVRLVLEGAETEIDKYLVERLKEPLLHLVRNAVSHGLETPAERRAAGKPGEGVLRLQAFTAGDTVVIQIEDDGRGIQVDRVARRAADAGLRMPAAPDAAELLELLCTSGFSTRDDADRTSGRGMGMAVVAGTVRELGGSLALEHTPGQGTRFTLRLPLTLSIGEMLIVSAGGQTYAVPQGSVDEIVQVPTAGLHSIRQVDVIPYRAGILPLVWLGDLLGGRPAERRELPVLVVRSDRGSAGLVVDRIHSQREVVVRPLQDPLVRVSGISGATELGDGRPVLILDPLALTAGAVRPARSTSSIAPGRPTSA